MILGLLVAAGLLDSWVIGAGTAPTSDPIVFFLSQGVLGVVVVMLWREYLSEKRKREDLVNKLINDFVPLLTRATEVVERRATEEEEKRRGK